MPSTSLAYRALIRCAVAVAPGLALGRPKLRAGLIGRVGVLERVTRWAALHRDPGRPLLWMHAASMGEGLQAEVVLHALRGTQPGWQIVFSYFSPSAAPLAARLDVDFSDVLPYDRRNDVTIALEALRPAAVVFSKLDVWPELATQAASRGAGVGIIAATVSPDARRLRWPARALTRPGYRAVTHAGAIAEADAKRLARLGVPAGRIEITGDPRFDSALTAARGIRPGDPLLHQAGGEMTLVAGSTWPEDEEVLLAAFALVRAAQPAARLVLVPHEPTTGHLERIDRTALHHGLEAVRLGSARGTEPLVVVDRVGALATLYAGSPLAYVGGGFGTTGLHSVLEPAACGVAVLFGPRWEGSPDAAALLRRRAAAAVSPLFPDWLDVDSGSTHADRSPLSAIWLALLRNPGHLRAAGRRGLAYVEAGCGAASRTAGLVERLMSGGASAR